MKTVKQVSELTGVSVRMLHYYDKIGLLKPSEVTDAGYRLYDDDALMTLQQILFYKEIDIPLKEVKDIMYSPNFDKKQALQRQKKLLELKCKRLNDVIELIDKTIKGENTMSFQEFDMSEYYKALEELKQEHKEQFIKAFGSMDKYNDFSNKLRNNETEIAKMAISKYGSIDIYVKAMKKNFDSNIFTKSEQIDKFKKDCLEGNHSELKERFEKLALDINKDTASIEIQKIAEEIKEIAFRDYEVFRDEMGLDYWHSIIQVFLLLPDWQKEFDNKYGIGAAIFIGKVLKRNLGENKPKIDILWDKLTSDLTKDPSSIEIQEIIKEIVSETDKKHKLLNIDEGVNHWRYTADQYLTDSILAKAINNKYGKGSARFFGEALQFYLEKISD